MIAVRADFAFMASESVEAGMQPSLVVFDDDDKEAFCAIGVRTKTVTEQTFKHFEEQRPR